jgi:flavin-dependent dehydrogenase
LNQNQFDVIILGAGISGLLLGSELSKKHSLLVIEKENSIPNNKYWLTNNKCLIKNTEFNNCIDSEYEYMDFYAYDSSSYRCYGKYILWNTEKLLNELTNIIYKNSGVILKKHSFYNYHYSVDGITISANDKKFKTKLLIDCMGYSSPIIYSKNMIEIYGYYLLYGKVLNLKQDIEPIGLSNIILSQQPKYIEIFPKKNKQAYVILIVPEKSLKHSEILKNEFTFIIEKSEYSNFFYKPESNENHLSGLIPVGKLRYNSLDRIFLFGEAGQMNPSSTATCFTQLLYSYKEICKDISERILYNQLSKSDLAITNPYFSKRNKEFHLNLFKRILNWNSDDFKKLIHHMNNMDNNLVNAIIFGEINFDSLLNLKNILGLIKKRNYFVLNPLIKSLF